VVDTNAFGEPRLLRHLRQSEQNRVAIPEAVVVEIFNGDVLRNLEEKFLPLEPFSNQVLLLKSGIDLLRVRPRAKGMHGRLTDTRLTRLFPLLCSRTRRALSGNKADLDFIRQFEKGAGQFSYSEEFARSIRKSLGAIESTFALADVKKFRSGQLPSERFTQRYFQHLKVFVSDVLSEYSIPLPGLDGILDTYIFRFALFYEAAALDAIHHGSLSALSNKRLTHDFRDTTILAVASFFDGISTNDKAMLTRARTGITILRFLKAQLNQFRSESQRTAT